MSEAELKNLKKETEKLEYDLVSRQNMYIEKLERKIKELETRTICGRTIEEVITILNGLDLERLLDIKMTMENLSYLYKKAMEQEAIRQQELLKKISKGGVIDEC